MLELGLGDLFQRLVWTSQQNVAVHPKVEWFDFLQGTWSIWIQYKITYLVKPASSPSNQSDESLQGLPYQEYLSRNSSECS